MGQEIEFDFVEAMLVQLVLHMQGFLDVHFLQDLKTFPSKNVTPLMKTVHLFPAVPVLSTGNQNYTRLTGSFSAPGQKDCTLLHFLA